MNHELMIDVADLQHAYSHGGVVEPVLHGIELEVQRGEFVIIMGPSGCGKTTLLNVLGLIMAPTRASRVHIAGQDTLTLSDAGRTRLRREALGFVFQRFNLLPTISVARNMELPLRISGRAVNHQVERLAGRMGLRDCLHKKPGQISVGQQQRVALARALVNEPALLLADEPTGNLDSANTVGVLQTLADLHQERRQTIVMITHNEQLASYADRVLHMRDGRFID